VIVSDFWFVTFPRVKKQQEQEHTSSMLDCLTQGKSTVENNQGYIVSYTLGYHKLKNPWNRNVTLFQATPGGLYTFQVPTSGVSLVQMVSENRSFFTPRKIAQVKLA
jgi:hypothetical protein